MKFCVILSALMALSATTSWSQTMALDPSFDKNGIVSTTVSNLNDVSKTLVQQKDGKILAAGYTTNNNRNEFCTIRYNVDGSVDKSFGNNGIVTTSFSSTGSSLANTLTLQADSRIIVAGSANGIAIVRYKTDGSIDNSFGSNGMVITNVPNGTARASSIIVQPDGKILIGGHYQNSAPDGYAFLLARYNQDGSLDASFGNSGIATLDIAIGQGLGALDFLQKIILQPDGKILAAGVSGPDAVLIRLDNDGRIDSLFGTKGMVLKNYSTTGNSMFNDIALQTDGKIVAVGSATTSVPNFLVTRFNTNGVPDATFGNNGAVTIAHSAAQNYATSVLIQQDGKILVGGAVNDSNVFQFAIAQYNSNGSLASSFGTNGLLKTKADNNYSSIESMIMQADKKIVVAGSNNKDFLLARYSVDIPTYITDNKQIDTKLYPNPTFNSAMLTYILPYTSNVQIAIYTLDGRLLKVLEDSQKISSGTHKLLIDISTLPAGNYIVNINTGYRSSSTKIIKK